MISDVLHDLVCSKYNVHIYIYIYIYIYYIHRKERVKESPEILWNKNNKCLFSYIYIYIYKYIYVCLYIYLYIYIYSFIHSTNKHSPWKKWKKNLSRILVMLLVGITFSLANCDLNYTPFWCIWGICPNLRKLLKEVS